MAGRMKQNSVLQQLYSHQQQSIQQSPQEVLQLHGNYCLLFRWILVGALVNSIVLAPFLVFYIRQQENFQTTMSTVETTTRSLRWYSTGTIVAGTGSVGTAANELNNPYGLALDSSNSLYIIDRFNHRVQKYLSGTLNGTTVAGQANAASGNTPSRLKQPGYLIVDSHNNIYVTDSANHRVQYWPNGATSGITVAGNGTQGNASNQFDTPRGVARDSSTGTLYIADQLNHRIMCYTAGATSGTIVAGGNGCGPSSTQICSPVGLQLDSSSNSLFISNYATHTIIKWILGTSSGTIIAGIYATPGLSPTLLNSPTGFVLDSMKNIYVADTFNHRIVLFMSGQNNGTTIAGNPFGISGNNLSSFSYPFWVSVDTQLNLYVSDRGNQRVLKFLRY